MMKKISFFIFIFLFSVCVGAYFLFPWASFFQHQAIIFLGGKGIKNVSFKIDDVGMSKASISQIKIGVEDPVTLGNAEIEYSLSELRGGKFKFIKISGLSVNIVETNEGWGIEGIGGRNNSKTKIDFSNIFDAFPFTEVLIEDGRLKVLGKRITIEIPLNARVIKTPDISFEATIGSADIVFPKAILNIGGSHISVKQDGKKNWLGMWDARNAKAETILPAEEFEGSGKLSAVGDNLVIEGKINSNSNDYAASFNSSINLGAPSKNVLTIDSISFPFKEGRISSKDIKISFDRERDIVVPLNVTNVSLDALMQSLTGERITATGTVSGNIPLIVKPDGAFSLGKGVLKANGRGLIQMPGDVIPGDNEQVVLVRKVLENLHYSLFSASVEASDDQKMYVKLSLEGSNPDVYGGRIIKLNVNLTGDVLDFVRQNAMLFTNPETLLESKTP